MYEYSQLNIYLDERAKVIDRMYKKDGFEMRRNLKVSKGKYPQVFITKKTTYLHIYMLIYIHVHEYMYIHLVCNPFVYKKVYVFICIKTFVHKNLQTYAK